jgi:hypothetical protein
VVDIMQTLPPLGFLKGCFYIFTSLVWCESKLQNGTFLPGLAQITKLPNDLEQQTILVQAKRRHKGEKTTQRAPDLHLSTLPLHSKM